MGLKVTNVECGTNICISSEGFVLSMLFVLLWG